MDGLAGCGRLARDGGALVWPETESHRGRCCCGARHTDSPEINTSPICPSLGPSSHPPRRATRGGRPPRCAAVHRRCKFRASSPPPSPSQNTCRDTRNDSRRELLKKCTLRFLFAEGFMCDAPRGVSKDQTEIVFQLTAERPDLLLFFPPVYLPLYLAEQQPSSPSWSDHHCLGTGHQQNTHISCRILVWGGLDNGGQDFGRTNFLTKFLSPLF